MIGWLIVLLISILSIVVGIILYRLSCKGYKFDAEEVSLILMLIGGLIAVISIALIIFYPMKVKKELREFEYVQEIVNETLSEAVVVNNIIKANEWYAEAKAKKATFGIFSFLFGNRL